MKSVPVVAAVLAVLLLAPAVAYAQVKPNDPNKPVVEDPVQPEPPAPTPIDPSPPPTPDPPAPQPPGPTPVDPPPPQPDKPDDEYRMITATDPQTIIDALKSSGYDGAMEPLSSGRPRIRVIIAGTSSSVYFYDCLKDMTGCRTLLFSTSIDLKDGAKLADANKWNAEQVWGRVYLDGDGDPHLDVMLNTGDVLPWVRFNETVEGWEKLVAKFKTTFVGS